MVHVGSWKIGLEDNVKDVIRYHSDVISEFERANFSITGFC